MESAPSEAAVYADSKYGSRSKDAFNSMGTRPIEVLMENGEMTINQIHRELTEDEEAGTTQKPHVKKYFEVLEDCGFVDYTEHGDLWAARNKTVQKNGAPMEEIEKFVELYRDN